MSDADDRHAEEIRPLTPESSSPEASISESESPTTTTTTATTPATTTTLADAANIAITFLSTAPSEQLIAISIAGTVVLYIVFGQLGLIAIGVIAGAVGHATLSLTTQKDGSGLSAGLTQWIEARKPTGDEKATVLSTAVDFSSLPPETAKAMEELTEAVVRDYIK